MDKCPFVEIKTPHGRLIDGDERIECVLNDPFMLQTEKNKAVYLLRSARSIVPAEGGTDNGN
jgi:hypothetical protein